MTVAAYDMMVAKTASLWQCSSIQDDCVLECDSDNAFEREEFDSAKFLMDVIMDWWKMSTLGERSNLR